jgi:hypothetical protein
MQVQAIFAGPNSQGLVEECLIWLPCCSMRAQAHAMRHATIIT